MALIAFAELMFGTWFVFRMLRAFRERALLSVSAVTKIGTLHVLACTSFSLLTFRSSLVHALAVVGVVIFTIGALFIFEHRRLAALKAEVPLFLDRWILNLRLGWALTSAREAALSEHSESFRILLQPLFATHAQAARHALLSAPQVRELERLQREPHLALARLEHLRRLLRKSSEFRRKSGQATQQTRIQCVIMLFLLFALTAFNLRRYGWSRSADLILSAQLLSWIGVSVMYAIARKTRWKI